MFLCLVQRQAIIGNMAFEKPFNINVAQSTFPQKWTLLNHNLHAWYEIQKWTLLNHNLHAWYGSFFDLLVNIGSFESDKSTLVNILHIRPKFKFTCWHSCSIWRETAINVVSEDIVTCYKNGMVIPVTPAEWNLICAADFSAPLNLWFLRLTGV